MSVPTDDKDQLLECAMAQAMAPCATAPNFLQYDKGGIKRDAVATFAPMIMELIKLRPSLSFTPGETKAALARLAIMQSTFDDAAEAQDWNTQIQARLGRMMRHVKQYRIRKNTTVVRRIRVWEARLRCQQAEGGRRRDGRGR